MFKPEFDNHTILDFAQGGNVAIAADSFINDRREANFFPYCANATVSVSFSWKSLFSHLKLLTCWVRFLCSL